MSEAPFVYHFDHATGEYLGTSSADTDPMDAGRWVVPAFATLSEPSAPQKGFVAAFVGDEWTELMDCRGQKWWNPAKEPVVIDFLGDPADRGMLDEEPEIEPEPPTLEDYEDAIQGVVDATAKERLFRDGVTLASYVASTNQQWAADAQAFVAWRDTVWVYAFNELEKVQNGERSVPTPEEFCEELPAVAWPG